MKPKTSHRPRLVYVTTHPMSARWLLRGQLRAMRERGCDVTLIVSPGDDLQTIRSREGIEVVPLPIAREMQPLADAVALGRLVRQLRRLRPQIVNAGTPKAGLLGVLAARLAQVPIRYYTLRGLRLETASGSKAAILRRTERLAAACATRVLVNSPSLRQRFLELQLCDAEKAVVLGAGSGNGLDLSRFSRDGELQQRGARWRDELGIPAAVPVIGFVGRLTRDKGVADLVAAFAQLQRQHDAARLVLVGDFEPGDPLPQTVRQQLANHPGIVVTGFLPDTSYCYAAFDVLAFPSYREGLPNVPLEAAACGVPVAGYRATGTVDAVADGRGGTLVDVGDWQGLAAALGHYLAEPALRIAHGQAAERWVRARFDCRVVWHRLADEYQRALQARFGDQYRLLPSMVPRDTEAA